MELQPIAHVWINHDNDLVDLALTTKVPATKGHPARQQTEVIHATQKHPFLTVEDGFVPVANLMLGMHVVEGNGRVGTIDGWQVVAGVSVMYDLEVANDHTFTVGDGLWMVHNCGDGDKTLQQDAFRAPDRKGNLNLQLRPGEDALSHTAEPTNALRGDPYRLPAGTKLPSSVDVVNDGYSKFLGTDHISFKPADGYTQAQFEEGIQELAPFYRPPGQ